MLCTPLWSEMGRSSAMAAYAGIGSSFSAKRAPKVPCLGFRDYVNPGTRATTDACPEELRKSVPPENGPPAPSSACAPRAGLPSASSLPG